ncbi:hypothetical protein BD413DRAFT_113190 [Trametes elegans]|nr:hypothetical protein BD413DRAFT_113190 [Trametes elegans]
MYHRGEHSAQRYWALRLPSASTTAPAICTHRVDGHWCAWNHRADYATDVGSPIWLESASGSVDSSKAIPLKGSSARCPDASAGGPRASPSTLLSTIQCFRLARISIRDLRRLSCRHGLLLSMSRASTTRRCVSTGHLAERQRVLARASNSNRKSRSGRRSWGRHGWSGRQSADAESRERRRKLTMVRSLLGAAAATRPPAHAHDFHQSDPSGRARIGML